jgi:hypothetical protein
MSKCISHVHIILQFCHFHLKFGWCSFSFSDDIESKLIVATCLKISLKRELNSCLSSGINSISWLFLCRNCELCRTISSQLQFPQSKLPIERSYFVKYFIDNAIGFL